MDPDIDPPPTFEELVELLSKLSNEELEGVAQIVARLLNDLTVDDD